MGEYPKMLIMAKAIFRCKPDFSSARTTRNIPNRRIIIGDIYSAPTALSDKTPVMGNSAKGNKEVAYILTASVIHHMTSQSVIPATIFPLLVNPVEQD